MTAAPRSSLSRPVCTAALGIVHDRSCRLGPSRAPAERPLHRPRPGRMGPIAEGGTPPVSPYVLAAPPPVSSGATRGDRNLLLPSPLESSSCRALVFWPRSARRDRRWGARRRTIDSWTGPIRPIGPSHRLGYASGHSPVAAFPTCFPRRSETGREGGRSSALLPLLHRALPSDDASLAQGRSAYISPSFPPTSDDVPLSFISTTPLFPGRRSPLSIRSSLLLVPTLLVVRRLVPLDWA